MTNGEFSWRGHPGCGDDRHLASLEIAQARRLLDPQAGSLRHFHVMNRIKFHVKKATTSKWSLGISGVRAGRFCRCCRRSSGC